MSKTQELYEEAKRLIPTGTQLFSKKPELYAPEQWPAYYRSASGITIVDLDGCIYRDFSTMGLGACALGYADPDVDRAVVRACTSGSVSSLNCGEEIELAKMLTLIHPWSGMVRYARSGGEAIAIAVRIARAYTGKDRVLVCGYHGWHDWYLAGGGHLPGLSQKGVPIVLKGITIPCRFNHLEDFEPYGGVGAIVVEPIRHEAPAEGFLEGVRAVADRLGAVLIFDEISSGFRFCLGGAHLQYKVNPDIAVFAKAMSNGYPMASVIGTKEVMSTAQDTFISSTSWSERIGPTAAIATIQKFWAKDVHERLQEVGEQVQAVWKYAASRSGLEVTVTGPPQLSQIDFGSAEVRTLYTQLMLEKGFLAGKDFYPTYSHSQEDVEDFLVVCKEVFRTIQQAKEKGIVKDLLKGPVAQEGFRRTT